LEKKSNYVAIYVPDMDFIEWELFKKICKREGNSPSEKIRGFFKNYNSEHQEGNPQTKLEYSEEVKCLPKWKTCRLSDKKLVEGEFYCHETNFWKIPMACDKCKTFSG
jgi:hypothetical protein